MGKASPLDYQDIRIQSSGSLEEKSANDLVHLTTYGNYFSGLSPNALYMTEGLSLDTIVYLQYLWGNVHLFREKHHAKTEKIS